MKSLQSAHIANNISGYHEMNNIFYFSYGSNMSSRRLQQRVSDVQVIDTGELKQHQLTFHKKSHDGSGKCDAWYDGDENESVLGVVFKMTASQLLLLDEFEGLGSGYDRKTVHIITHGSGTLEAVTYYATDIDQSMRPYQWYMQHVLRGAEEHGLPAAYIETIRQTEAIHDPNKQRHETELRIYQ